MRRWGLLDPGEKALRFKVMEKDSIRAQDFDAVIRRRQTFKVLGDPDHPRSIPDAVAQRCRQEVREALQTAGWAPFHYDQIGRAHV